MYCFTINKYHQYKAILLSCTFELKMQSQGYCPLNAKITFQQCTQSSNLQLSFRANSNIGDLSGCFLGGWWVTLGLTVIGCITIQGFGTIPSVCLWWLSWSNTQNKENLASTPLVLEQLTNWS